MVSITWPVGAITSTVTLLAAPWADRGLPRAQTALDAYLDDTGTDSVHAALRGDVTLGDLAVKGKTHAA